MAAVFDLDHPAHMLHWRFFQMTLSNVLVMALMGFLSLAFVLVPFIHGVRDLPRRIRLYKLIWRDHYRTLTMPPTASE